MSSSNVKESIPLPDPTLLTTQNLLHEIEATKELFGTQLSALTSTVKGMAEDFGHEIENTEKLIRGIYDEKFSAIKEQFRERDVRVEQTARTSDAALQAALQAAKEAVGKQTDFFTTTISELKQAITKQLDALTLLITNMGSAFDGKITDVKERVGVIEGADRGQRNAVHERQASVFNSANIWGIVLGILGGVGLIITVAILLTHK